MRKSYGLARALPLVVASTFLVSGCSSSSTAGTATSYAASFNKARPGFGQPDMAIVDNIYMSDGAKKSGAGMLANWEMGAAHHTVGQWDKSRDHFLKADAIARDLEGKALISGGDVAKTAGSLLTNDNSLEFKGDTYEKVMAHSLNAMNFLALDDLQGARVEIRKADEYQKAALERHAKAIAKAAEKDDRASTGKSKADAEEAKRNEDAVRGQKEVSGEYEKMTSFTSSVKNSFQDPFTYFLSGLVYELHGEKDDALIDYRKALELAPNSVPLKTSVLRVLTERGDQAEVDQMAAKFGPNVAAAAGTIGSTQGEVVVIYEVGFIPQKQQVKFPLPMPGGSIGFTAFPVYTDYNASPERLELTINSTSFSTEPVVDLHVLAVKALQEKWFGIASRELARVVAKELAQKGAELAAEKAAGSYGKMFAQIGGAIYKAATQNADLRSFYGLPQQVQAARIVVPAGVYRIPMRRVGLAGPPVETTLTVTVRAGKKTIVTIRSLSNSLSSFPLGTGA